MPQIEICKEIKVEKETKNNEPKTMNKNNEPKTMNQNKQCSTNNKHLKTISCLFYLKGESYEKQENDFSNAYTFDISCRKSYGICTDGSSKTIKQSDYGL